MTTSAVMRPSRMSNVSMGSAATSGSGVSGHTPGSAPRKHNFSRSSSGYVDPVDDSENLNPLEDVHQSLRSTANAIQNYPFDSSAVPTASGSKTAAFDSS